MYYYYWYYESRRNCIQKVTYVFPLSQIFHGVMCTTNKMYFYYDYMSNLREKAKFYRGIQTKFERQTTNRCWFINFFHKTAIKSDVSSPTFQIFNNHRWSFHNISKNMLRFPVNPPWRTQICRFLSGLKLWPVSVRLQLSLSEAALFILMCCGCVTPSLMALLLPPPSSLWLMGRDGRRSAGSQLRFCSKARLR